MLYNDIYKQNGRKYLVFVLGASSSTFRNNPKDMFFCETTANKYACTDYTIYKYVYFCVIHDIMEIPNR